MNRVLALLFAAAVCCASAPGAPAPRPPNVVLFFIDCLRAAQVHCLGYPRETTPSLDALAGRGTLFGRAIAPSSWSLPSYCSMFTSLPPPAHAVDERNQFLDSSFTTLAEIMAANGYDTGGFVGGGHLSRVFGLDQGFQTYRDQPHYGSLFHTVPAAVEWLRGRRQKPFFLVAHGYDAHLPYQPPLVFGEMYDPAYKGVVHDLNVLHGEVVRSITNNVFHHVVPAPPTTGPAPVRDVPLGPADIAHMVAHYDGAVTYADTWLGLFLESLERSGRSSDTFVVVAGDHGEDLGEHGYFGHRWTMYDRQLHVPLVVAGPGIARGRVVSDVVELTDLAPTLLDLAGITPCAEHKGRSLRDYVDANRAPPADPEHIAYSSLSTWLSARTRRWHLLLGAQGQVELYDLEADPAEQTNVAAREVATRDRLASLLRDWDEKYRAEPRGPGAHLTDAEKAMFRRKGYW